MAYDRLLQEVLAAKPECALKGKAREHEDLRRDVRDAHAALTTSNDKFYSVAKHAIAGFSISGLFCGATGIAALIQALRPGGLGSIVHSIGTWDISEKIVPTLAAVTATGFLYGARKAYGLYHLQGNFSRLNEKLEGTLRELAEFEMSDESK